MATKSKNKNSVEDLKRVKVSQAEFPIFSLEQSIRLANALWENFAGKSAQPHALAMAIDLSPTSGGWRNLCGSSIAYGLTEGGYNANEITLTELGRRVVAPTSEGDNAKALGEAVLKPRVMRDFFTKYDRAKFPRDDIAMNVLVSLGLPKERAERALEILKENGNATSIVVETKTGPFVTLVAPGGKKASAENGRPTAEDEDEPSAEAALPTTLHTPELPKPEGNRVFITHGKNKKILDQVKEIVKFGKFEPVVAQEHETVSKPVPQKVLDDMRTCQAGVIHVGSEGFLLDDKGNQVPQVNGNVLIEIGAAMALYKSNFVLLVEDGIELPSNLQGLYECRYKGNELGMEATMKLLKAFNDFK